MRATYSVVLFSMAIVLLSCSRDDKRTPEQNYYVEIRAHQQDAFNEGVVEFLKLRIPQQKYTITNRSGLSWPYYAALELDETISTDSLMPPHWHLHRMILQNPTNILEKDDHLIRIDVMPRSDTLPNYRVEIYEIDSTGLKLSGSSGIHYVDTVEFFSRHARPVEFSSRQQLYDYYLKSIIRYSFK